MENIFIILLGLSMVYLSSTSRLAAHVNMLMVQGWLLFLICLSGFAGEPWFSISILTNKEALVANSAHLFGLLFVVFETLVIKAYVIPWFLKKVVKKTHAHRDTDANIPHFYCLVISSVILFAGFLTANIAIPVPKNHATTSREYPPYSKIPYRFHNNAIRYRTCLCCC